MATLISATSLRNELINRITGELKIEMNMPVQSA